MLLMQLGEGDAYFKNHDHHTAREFYIGTIESVIPTEAAVRNDPDGLDWLNLSTEAKQSRFHFVELGVAGVQRASRSLGELEVAIKYALFMIDLRRSEEFELSAAGHETMLEIVESFVLADGFVCRGARGSQSTWFLNEEAMEDAGVPRRRRSTTVEFALSLAREIVEDAGGSTVGVSAADFLIEVRGRPDVDLPMEELMAAAQAELLGESYGAAIASYYKILGIQESMPATGRADLAAGTYHGLGNALWFEGRKLESALVFREALLRWPSTAWDVKNAKKYYYAIRSFTRYADGKNGPAMRELIAEASRFGGGPLDIDVQRPNYVADIRGEREHHTFEQIVKHFRDDKARGHRLPTRMISEVAEALIMTQDYAAAKELLIPLLLGEGPRRATHRDTILMGRVMAGAVTGNNMTVCGVPGAGGTDSEFDLLTKRQSTFRNSIPSWTCEWFEAMFTMAHTYYVWGQRDATKLEVAKALLEGLKDPSAAGLSFALVDASCDVDGVDPLTRARLGHGTLSSRYVWLWKMLH